MSATLFDRLRMMNLPAGDYAVFGSGPLLVRGIIHSCNDLDVICRGAAWQAVRVQGAIEFLPEYDIEIVTMLEGKLTFGTRWGIGDFDIDELIESAEIIDDLPFVRLEHVVAYKKTRASTKDVQHLEALKNSKYAIHLG